MPSSARSAYFIASMAALPPCSAFGLAGRSLTSSRPLASLAALREGQGFLLG